MARTTRFWLLALPILLLILMHPAVPRAETVAPASGPVRLALVVGDGDYRAGPLPTAANDAGLVAQSLAQAGFDVTAAANLDSEALHATLDAFLAKAKSAGPDAILVVYLSGYGLQFAGENYVVPIDASIGRDLDVPMQAVPLSELMRQLASVPAKARVLVGDLARQTPFAKAGTPLAPGLALIVPPAGVVAAFNAAPSAEAPVDALPYGAYARALAEMIQTPGLSLESVFARVRLRAGELTNGVSVPWTSGTFGDATPSPAMPASATPVSAMSAPVAVGTGEGTVPGADVTAASAYSALIASDTLADDLAFLKLFPIDALTPRVRAMAASRREAMIWSDSVTADSARAFWTYMRRYPRGPHFADARRRLVRLHAQLEPPPRFDIVTYDDVTPPPPGEADLLDSFGAVKGPAIPTPPASLVPPQRGVFSDDMLPPPLALVGMVPIPMPIPLPEGVRVIGAAGTITQPSVPGVGPIVVKGTIETSGSTLTAIGKNGLLSKAIESFGSSHSIVQTDSAGSIISRTEAARDRTGVTIVQTGPGGGIVLKLTTRSSPGGGRSTMVTNGSNETVSIVTRDDQGIVTSVTPGSVSTRDLNPVYQPAGPGQHPVLLRPTVPALAPVKAPAERAALAAPMPPPVLALPPLPAAPVASPSPPRPDTAKPATPDKAVGGPSQPEPPKLDSAPPSAAPAAGLPAAIPEPPHRQDAIEPKHGTKPKAVKAGAARHAAPARSRAARSGPLRRRR
jgi:hypothetical protein